MVVEIITDEDGGRDHKKLLFLRAIFTLLGSDRVGSQKVCIDDTIHHIITMWLSWVPNCSLPELEADFQSL